MVFEKQVRNDINKHGIFCAGNLLYLLISSSDYSERDVALW